MPAPETQDDNPEEDPISALDLPACVMQALSPALRDQLVLAVNARKIAGRRPPPRRQQQPGPGARRSTPPRGAQDVRCGNCGEKGHTAQQCSKPRVPMKERKCHTCGKTGHVARNCPAAKANVAEAAGFKPFVGEPRALMIVDDEGFQQVPTRHERVPRPPTLGDFVRPARRPQGERRSQNRYAALGHDGSPS